MKNHLLEKLHPNSTGRTQLEWQFRPTDAELPPPAEDEPATSKDYSSTKSDDSDDSDDDDEEIDSAD